MPTKRASDLYIPDPADGFRIAKVGGWVEEKHLRLRRYVDISRAARRRWRNEYGKETGYIDLYCGPGRAMIKGTGEVIDGSAVVAATEAAAKGVPFSDIYVADLDEQNVVACAARLTARSCTGVHAFAGSAVDTSRQVVQKIDRTSLHIAFLDPFNIGSLPFEVIRTLGQVKHLDMIIHVSTMDLQRNLRAMIDNGILDEFAPGWAKRVDVRERNELVMGAVFRHWRSCLASLDYKVSDNIERVSGAKNQPLYWLVLASRSELADKFWGQISQVSPQGALPL